MTRRLRQLTQLTKPSVCGCVLLAVTQIKNKAHIKRQIMSSLSVVTALLLLVITAPVTAFQPSGRCSTRLTQGTKLWSSASSENSRRDFCQSLLVAGASALWVPPQPAQASVFLDPAMYGDQENRVAAVDSLRERVRQAILRKPELTPSFYQMALLDGLSYNVKTREFGPDGRVVRAILSSKNDDFYTSCLKEAATVLVEASISLKKYTSITIGDAVAIGGAESIETIGGPILSVQLGRTEAPKNVPLPTIPLDLFNGNATPQQINAVFESAGLTSREMTALLTALLTLDTVEKSRTPGDWKASARPKYRERGKMGRMSEFKRLTDEDIAAMEQDDYDEDPDDGWYIADSFGTREQAFGQRIQADIDEKSFNKYVKEINTLGQKKGAATAAAEGYIQAVLMDKNNPPVQSWLNKYAASNLSYLKDLGIAYNAVTQLGAEYTGGKYENLLKNKPRKSLNDDDLGIF